MQNYVLQPFGVLCNVLSIYCAVLELRIVVIVSVSVAGMGTLIELLNTKRKQVVQILCWSKMRPMLSVCGPLLNVKPRFECCDALDISVSLMCCFY